MLNYPKNIKVLALSISVAILLPACASTGDGSEDIDDRYMKSQQGPALQMPADTTELEIEDSYRVPEGTVITQRDAKGKAMNLEPPQLLLVAGDGIWEDTERSKPTVWVRGDSQQLVKYIERFMKAQGIGYAEPSVQSVTTDWISDSEESAVSEYLGSYYVEGQRHKFELKIVDSKPNEVALQAIHLANQHNIDGQWTDVKTSERVAKQFLNYFIGYFDSERTREARERILQEAKVDFELGYSDKGSLALITEREFLAVWEQIPRVLTALNLSVIDRDRSAKTYYFNVKEPESGFWSWFSSDEDAKVDLEPGDYQLQLSELSTGGMAMSFYGAEGEQLDSSLVTKLYPQFSAEFKRGKE